MKKALLVLLIYFFLADFTVVKAANQHDVLINEIAWMGSTDSASNEWIELLNNTDNAIDVSGWTLKSADEKLKINLKGKITAKEFYLLERTDDSSVPGIAADLIYMGALNNKGLDLKLYDSAENLIDEASYPIKWPAGNNVTKQTMERTDLLNWRTSQNPNGTPKALNSTGEKVNSTDSIALNPKTQIPPQNTTENNQLQNQTQNKSNDNTIITAPYSEGIFINEILPAPEGPDETNEWIELYNSNPTDTELSGWKLQDTSGTVTTYNFPKNLKIQSLGYLVFKRPQTKIILNNDGDTLNLIQPDGKITDVVSYENALKNQSYNRTNDDWQWSKTLTPGAKNIILGDVFKEEKALSKIKKPANKINMAPAAVSNPIDNLRDISNKEKGESSPWVLFLTTGGAILFSGIGVAIWKSKSINYKS